MNTINRDAVLRALVTYDRRHDWWKFWMARGYTVDDPMEGWISIEMRRSYLNSRKLTEYLSRELHCRALCLGKQTTVGQEFIHLAENGTTRRLVCFCPGEDDAWQIGTPLPFEQEYINLRKQEAEEELSQMDEELRRESQWMLKPTTHLPGCDAFAKALECASYEFGVR